MKTPKPITEVMEQLKPSLQEKLKYSISLLKKAEKLALRYDKDQGFFLAFSGGKDSQALYHVADLAGVRFHSEMNATSVDPPEVIQFVRRNYLEVKITPPHSQFSPQP